VIEELLINQSPVQAIVVIAAVCALGLAMGKIKVFGISLGIAFVFFVGILAGHVGLRVNTDMLNWAETFGLVLFVYALGLHVGPNFFGSLKHEGLPMNIWGFALIVVGTVLAMVLTLFLPVSIPDMVGLLCGATTNTPALGAAQQALKQLGEPAESLALGTAVTYPLGVLGVILSILFMRKLFVKPRDLEVHVNDDAQTYVGQYVVKNPAVVGKTVGELSNIAHFRFVISRVWRDDKVIVPGTSTPLVKDDSLMVISQKEDVDATRVLFGEQVKTDWNREKIDWNGIDAEVVSRVIVLTRVVLNGRRLSSLHLRDSYGVNVSRVIRGDVKLLATPDLILRYGDRLTVVGHKEDVDHAEAFIGNAVKTLKEPNLGSIFFGMILGLILGAVSLSIPGMSAPVHLGIAGGPVIMGILVGALCPRLRFISYTTRSASLMLRKMGLSLYLACLGLAAGGKFFDTVVRPEGLMWIGIGFVLTVVPTVIVGLVMLRTRKMDFGTICGILCGSMANPMALGYVNETIEGDTPSISYATVYPVDMFLRVIIAQAIIMCFV
jgi:AspT/YidE/YbjL antiporter-like protein